MTIETNLGINFSNFKDLLTYMTEENIEEVIVSCDYWGANIPKQKLTIADINNIITQRL